MNELAIQNIPEEFREIASVLQLDAQLLGDYSVKAVNGRQLQEALGSTKAHTNWAKYQITRLKLEQGIDYGILSNLSTPSLASTNSRQQLKY
jgi:phage anti-repressor protein